MSYDVGSVIEYRCGSDIRRVLVEHKSDDIKNGRAGFSGSLVVPAPNSGPRVWGYDHQITRVEPPTLTTQDIENGYTDARWRGWGYLAERFRMADDIAERTAEAGPIPGPSIVDEADAFVLARAAERGWDAEDLFQWMNSKNGRWFGDWAFGNRDRGEWPPWVANLFTVPSSD